MEEGLIRVQAKFSKQFYPKFDAEIADGDFAIVSWEVIETEEGEPELHPSFNTITTKGNMSSFSRLETYTIVAREAPNDYGMQYDLVYIGQPADMTSRSAQKTFLSRILTENQVENIFDTLDNPVEIIADHNVKELTKVKGIGETTALNIIDKYEDNKDMSEIYIELDQYGITNKLMSKLLENYGSPQIVINTVKQNPYTLASEVHGIGFSKADEIAQESGLPWDSVERVKGFITHRLEEKGENGDSYIFANDLMYMVDDELGGVPSDIVGKAVKELEDSGKLGLDEGGEGHHKRVYLMKYYNLEQRVANELLRILGSENVFRAPNWEERVRRIELQQGWEYTDEQMDGIRSIIDNQITVISGKAGTGKSSAVTAVLKALQGYSFAQTALSGRASAKLQEITGEDGQTIHRLLEYHPDKGFVKNKHDQLDYDIIILDEISLVGGHIFLSLIEAIESGSKLIILGDDGQLESIGCMNLAIDLINSGVIPSVVLNKIHRQAQKSGIITEAAKIREHKQLVGREFAGTATRGELEDFELDIVKNTDETRPTILKHFKKWLPLVDDIMDIQIIVPVNERGDSSVSKLNLDIQEIYNPPSKNKDEIEIVINKKEDKKFIIRETDKIMITKNNYKTKNDFGKDTPIFNGWMGIVRRIYDNKAITYFPVIDDEVVIEGETLRELQLGYASTAHKQQGSSAKVLIGGIDYSTPPFMRTKELVYTMVTRASKHCVLVAQNPALQEAIDTSGVADKNTFLKELLESTK